MKTLYAALWALIMAAVIFGAIEIQKQITAEIDRRADAKNKQGWCNVQMAASTATMECSRVSKWEEKDEADYQEVQAF